MPHTARRGSIELPRAETAGQSVPQGAGEADMVGIANAREFRDAVLAQRDRMTAQGQGAAESSKPLSVASKEDTLVEIRDSLHRIEGILKDKNDTL